MSLDPRERDSCFWLHLLGLLCLYTLVLGLLPELEPLLPNSSTWISLPLQLVFVLGLLSFMRRAKLEPAALGLKREAAREALARGCATALPLSALVVLAKIAWVLSGGEGPIFVLPELLREHGPWMLTLWVALYLMSSAAQELVVRGGVQHGLELGLSQRHGPWTAVLGANVLFGLTHLHLSWGASVVAFLVGLVWGVQAARERSVVGVIVSHAIVGIVAFFVVGVGL